MQNILELEDGSSVLKLTVASYHRPNGDNIHRFRDSKSTDKWVVSPNPGMEVNRPCRLPGHHPRHHWHLGLL